MYDLLITEAADQDLDGIVHYIAIKLSNPLAASTFLNNVGKCYQQLRETPLGYAECSDPLLQAKRYRKAVIDNYLLVYRVAEDTNTVYILRFFYGGQDYAKQL